jgi:ceramide glucosyltransferase
VVQSVADFRTLHDLLLKRIRWMTVMRYMRPWGHMGLIFTFGLPWALIAIVAHPTAKVALIYLGAYFAFRIAMAWMIGVWGMKQTGIWKRIPLIPVWDAMAFVIWLISFGQKTIRWRGVDYRIHEGTLVPANRTSMENVSQ